MKDILPAVSKYEKFLCDTVCSKKAVCESIDCTYEQEVIAELSQKAKLVYEWTKTLNESLENAGKISDITKLAFHYKKKVLSSMQELRKNADILETLVAGKYWPYPTYGELLFGV